MKCLANLTWIVDFHLVAMAFPSVNFAQVVVEARGRLWIVRIADIAPPSGAHIVVGNCTSRANCEGVGSVVLASSPFGADGERRQTHIL